MQQMGADAVRSERQRPLVTQWEQAVAFQESQSDVCIRGAESRSANGEQGWVGPISLRL